MSQNIKFSLDTAIPAERYRKVGNHKNVWNKISDFWEEKNVPERPLGWGYYETPKGLLWNTHGDTWGITKRQYK